MKASAVNRSDFDLNSCNVGDDGKVYAEPFYGESSFLMYSKDVFEAKGLTAFAPTPFSSANAVGTLTTTAEELGLSTI